MKNITKYYTKAWFKVEYEIYDFYINFKGWKIQELNELNPEVSNIDNETSIEGHIKWDDCMNFTQEDHYCGIHNAKQTLILMTEIYKFKKKIYKY